MKTIEIRVPELGNAVGTTGWVASKLEHISNSLKVGATKSGKPCLTYEHWDDSKQMNNKGEFSKPRYVLCFISKSEDFNFFKYDNRYGYVWCVKMEDEGENTYIFPLLSDKAREIVDRFLNEVCKKFHDEYNDK